ncbi:MAG: hypothetical protein JRI68_32265 [Deltaproteobacteria bacterium]|nr:hypothetical protein [Deltaproteobacteria bacterium]
MVGLVGLALAGVGVGLTETGVSIGRTLILVGLPIAVLALLVAVFRRARPPEDAVSVPPTGAWAAIEGVAERCNFEWAPGRVTGTLKSHKVEATAPEPGSPVTVRCFADRELDLGLVVARERPAGDARTAVPVGDDVFDAAYSMRVDEPARGKGILTQRLRSLLLEMEARVDDSGVSLVLPECGAASLYTAMRYAARTTSELDRASSGVPCAKLLAEARTAWLDFAREHALASADTPLAMWGQIEGLEVSAVGVRDAFQNFHYEITASFAVPLDRGLELKPASSATRFDRSGEPVGHPAFDKIFVLKSRDALDATRLVGGETRNALLELRDWGLQMRIRDVGLWAWVGFDETNVGVVPKGLARMALITKRIADNAERFPNSQREPPSGQPVSVDG